MKVLLINTYSHGGAGAACNRLAKALLGTGVEVRQLSIADFGFNWQFYAERLSFLPYERDASVRFYFSLANFGKNLANHPDVLWADVLHLHWFNQGLLSLKGFSDLHTLGKKVVWTLHDMWAFTGGCHYSNACANFKLACGNCAFVKNPSPTDLSHQVFLKKQSYFSKHTQIVTCSRWLGNEARSSALLGENPITPIPNPIDTSVFQPLSEDERLTAKVEFGLDVQKKTLLFVAMNPKEERKGFKYFRAALEKLAESKPYLPLELLVMGKTSPEVLADLPFPSVALGLLKDVEKIARTYALADAFIIPSLEDNLPNTVMESLACGTPVIGFDTGGIPEMVVHAETGFIAEQRNVDQLCQGIEAVLFDNTEMETMRSAARSRVLENYTEQIVAAQYLRIYQSNLVV